MNRFLEDLEKNMQKTCFCEKQEKTDCCKSHYTGTSKLPENPTVTMAYVPFQTCTDQYEADTALCQGTLFPNLNKQFLGGKCI